MATVLLPRNLLDLFPGAERRHTVDGETVDAIVRELDEAVGLRNELIDSKRALLELIEAKRNATVTAAVTAAGSVGGARFSMSAVPTRSMPSASV